MQPAAVMRAASSERATPKSVSLAVPVSRSHQDVGRLHVAMHDAAGVDVGERLADLAAESRNQLRRQWAAGQVLAKGDAVDELHHEVGAAPGERVLVDAGVEDCHQTWV